MHSQEWQRTLGFIRTASSFATLHGQLARNALQFSSRGQASRGPAAPAASPDGNGNTREVPSTMFVKPTAEDTSTSSTSASDNFSLPNDVTIVPVYDARNSDTLDWNEVLPRLSETLPVYTGGEIPFGSFVFVGYTMTIYLGNNNKWTLGCNVLWVVILGSP
ncbi:hypothetical protein DFP72DRAFT_834254 [Ephemerocybe angulata]|uniref:Uncharacterized protein n=1 Tax=Ephemerocybe angulata TaxID=980116 RepID=A0A8H6H6L6_9AGAR|nr:hypothetical protein DFP72DRAFT_834254 [Tulosesus angulatus]